MSTLHRTLPAFLAACGLLRCAADAAPGKSTLAEPPDLPAMGGSAGAGNGGTSGAASATGGTSGTTMIALDGSAQDAPGDACGGFELDFERVRGTVLLVFDQSHTMDDRYGPGAPPKWQVARDAISAALLPIAGDLHAGALFFPTSDQTCDVLPMGTPPQITPMEGASFLTAFAAHFTPFATFGRTPLVLALQRADQALPDPAPFPGPRSVVVLADGYAVSCGDPTAAVGVIAGMHGRGIRTHVVGLPGASSGAALLDQMALAGGTGAYVEPANASALQAELASIATSTIDDCAFTLDPPPPDESDVHLLVGEGADAGLSEVPRGPDGWSLSDDLGTATLEGATCERAKAGELDAIKLVYGCPDHFVNPR